MVTECTWRSSRFARRRAPDPQRFSPLGARHADAPRRRRLAKLLESAHAEAGVGTARLSPWATVWVDRTNRVAVSAGSPVPRLRAEPRIGAPRHGQPDPMTDGETVRDRIQVDPQMPGHPRIEAPVAVADVARPPPLVDVADPDEDIGRGGVDRMRQLHPRCADDLHVTGQHRRGEHGDVGPGRQGAVVAVAGAPGQQPPTYRRCRVGRVVDEARRWRVRSGRLVGKLRARMQEERAVVGGRRPLRQVTPTGSCDEDADRGGLVAGTGEGTPQPLQTRAGGLAAAIGVGPRADDERDVDIPARGVAGTAAASGPGTRPASRSRAGSGRWPSSSAALTRPSRQYSADGSACSIHDRCQGAPPASTPSPTSPTGNLRSSSRSRHDVVTVRASAPERPAGFLARDLEVPAQRVAQGERAGSPHDLAEVVRAHDDRRGGQLGWRIDQQRPLREAHIRGPDRREASVEPGLRAQPGDRVGAVVHLVPAGVELAARAETATRALQYDVITVGGIQAGEDFDGQPAPAVRAAHQHGADWVRRGDVAVGEQDDAVTHGDRQIAFDAVVRRRVPAASSGGRGRGSPRVVNTPGVVATEKPSGDPQGRGPAAMSCDGAPSGFRTPDPLIKSQLLYQLS